MKHLKYILSFITCFTLCLMLCNVKTVFAATPTYDYTNEDDLINVVNKYDAIFASPVSTYFITCQPDSAIVLDSSGSVVLTEDMLSPNYAKGVVDLPRLQTRYQYRLSGTNEFYLAGTIYPSLCWTDDSRGSSCTLSIYSEDTNTALYSFTIVNNNLDGVEASAFSDCSNGMTQGLLDETSCVKISGLINCYDARLHTNSIVMPNYCITKSSLYENDNTTVPVYIRNNASRTKEFVDIKGSAHSFMRYSTDVRGIVNKFNVKDYVHEYQNSTNRPALLFAGNKVHAQCVYDNNTGDATTLTENTDTENLYSFIALNDNIYWQCVSLSPITTDVLDEKLDTASVYEWEATNIHDLLSYESIVTLGPTSFDSWWKKINKGLTKYGMYRFSHTSAVDVNDLNLYSETLMFAGVEPHIATVNLKHLQNTVTINYYVKTPNAVDYTLYNSRDYVIDDLKTNPNLLVSLGDLEQFTDYEPKGWYKDKNLQQSFSPSSLSNNESLSLNLYAGYNYIGGEYTVTFVNSQTGSQSQKTFLCKDKPTLPPSPETATKGYAFKNWIIVTALGDVTGTDYNPETFLPEKNKNYIFKTAWDVTGIITSVTTAKTSYYVGDTIDVSSLNVTVQTDSAGTTKTLSVSEFKISPTEITKSGTNQFVVTYNETGATAICEVEGVTVVPTGITAAYNGGNTIVGSTLDKNAFSVKLRYNNGTEKSIKDFVINPVKVLEEGSNQVTVSYTDFKTTVVVNGITDDTNKDKTLKSISATYNGNGAKLGASVDPRDFTVTAIYSDGSKSSLTSNQYNYSPSTYNNIGSNKITITYGGKTATVVVGVTSDYSGSDKNNSTNNSNSNSNSNSSNKNNSSSNSSNGSNGNNNSSNKNSNSSTSGGNTTVKTDDKTGTNSSNSGSNSSDDKGPSPAYLSGATILTNTMTAKVGTYTNTVDIAKVIAEASSSATKTSVTLVNGAVGNDITSDMLKSLKDKMLTLEVNMVSPEDENLVVGRWNIEGSNLGTNTYTTINPNINYEVREGNNYETLLYMSVTNSTYPDAAKLTMYPVANTYNYGSIVRMYSCDTNLDNATLVNTLTWGDSNALSPDIKSGISYCLSDSQNLHTNGTSLLDSVSENSVSANSVSEDKPSTEDTEDEPVFNFDDTDVVDDTPQNTTIPEKGNKSKALLFAVIIGILLLGTGVGVGAYVYIVKHPKTTSEYDDDEYVTDTSYDDQYSDSEESSDEIYVDDDDYSE